MTSVESNGAGTRLSGAGAVALGRPSKNRSRGAPGQLLTPIAPASWMLKTCQLLIVEEATRTHKSPGETIPAPPHSERHLSCIFTISSRPPLAGYWVSMSEKVIIEPSAPPPLVLNLAKTFKKKSADRHTPTVPEKGRNQ
jgi:hypothetical protein